MKKGGWFLKNIWYNNICSLDNIDEQNKMMRNGVIGSTADSDSVSRGSSPFSVVPWQGRRILRLSEMSGQYIGVWLSLVERYVRDVEVAGSNPVTPTGTNKYHKAWKYRLCGVFLFQIISWKNQKNHFFSRGTKPANKSQVLFGRF